MSLDGLLVDGLRNQLRPDLRVHLTAAAGDAFRVIPANWDY